MSHLLLCSIVLQNIQIFYRGSVIFIVTCFLSQPGSRNVLPEHCNVIIKQQLCGEELSSFCLCSKLILFKRSRLYCSKSSYTYQTSQKKVCIRPSDTDNSTQSLTRMYHHTATEILYGLHGAKISCIPTLAGVSY